jgi:hypothetical protein
VSALDAVRSLLAKVETAAATRDTATAMNPFSGGPSAWTGLGYTAWEGVAAGSKERFPAWHTQMRRHREERSPFDKRSGEAIQKRSTGPGLLRLPLAMTRKHLWSIQENPA